MKYSRIILKAVEIRLDNPLIYELHQPGKKEALFFGGYSYEILKHLNETIPRKINLENFNLVKGACVWKNNHFYWLMEYTFRKIIPAGIPQYIKKSIAESYMKQTFDKNVKIPKVFSFKDLEFGFIIWLASCSMAFVVFLMELIWFYGKIGLK